LADVKTSPLARGSPSRSPNRSRSPLPPVRSGSSAAVRSPGSLSGPLPAPSAAIGGSASPSASAASGSSAASRVEWLTLYTQDYGALDPAASTLYAHSLLIDICTAVFERRSPSGSSRVVAILRDIDSGSGGTGGLSLSGSGLRIEQILYVLLMASDNRVLDPVTAAVAPAVQSIGTASPAARAAVVPIQPAGPRMATYSANYLAFAPEILTDFMAAQRALPRERRPTQFATPPMIASAADLPDFDEEAAGY
jgi:hypothetical protein